MQIMSLEQINELDPKYKKLLALNQKQTAEILGVSCGTLENWRKEGVGPEYRKIDNGKKGRILYPKISIIDWISKTIKTM